MIYTNLQCQKCICTRVYLITTSDYTGSDQMYRIRPSHNCNLKNIDKNKTVINLWRKTQGSSYMGKYAQFELPGKFMKVSYNDSLSDKSM